MALEKQAAAEYVVCEKDAACQADCPAKPSGGGQDRKKGKPPPCVCKVADMTDCARGCKKPRDCEDDDDDKKHSRHDEDCIERCEDGETDNCFVKPEGTPAVRLVKAMIDYLEA